MRDGRRRVASIGVGLGPGGCRDRPLPAPAVPRLGDPAIVARCGVPTPGPTTNDCLTVNDVDWVATPLSDGTRFVTYGRDPAIEVLVPKAYAPEGSLLPAFAPAALALPTTGRKCG